MKISSFTLFIITSILALAVFLSFGEWLNVDYPDYPINLSITNQSSVYEDINSSVSKLQSSVEKISSARESGFLSVIAEGIYALPLALVEIPLLISTVIASSLSSLTNILFGFSVSPQIIAIIGTFVIAWGAFALISLFTGKDV